MTDLPGYQPHPGVLDSEAAVAAACMTGARYVDTAAEILTEDDFHNLGHASVFAAAAEISGRGGHVDAASVRNALIRNGNIRTLGADGGRLMDLMHIGAAPLAGIRYHADIVKADAIRRRAHAACLRGVQITSEATFETEHIGLILDELGNANPEGAEDRQLWVHDGLEDFLDGLDQPIDDAMLPTGWSDLDDRVKMRGGQVIVIGARPGGGKSLMGLQLAANAAIRLKHPALMLSMEMRRDEVMKRMYAAEAGVELNHLNDHRLTDADHARISKATNDIRTAPLVIDDTAHANLAHVRARLRWMARTAPAKLVVVDYVQLMTPMRRAENRALEVAEITRGLKVLAMEMDICVIALAQLNRGPEQRAGRKPTMSDLRESGSLENDADIVLFLHPEPEDPAKEGKRRGGEIDVVVAKNRTGPRDIDVPLAYHPHKARFGSMARPAWTPHDAARGAA
jgi:replicative DNA helicase